MHQHIQQVANITPDQFGELIEERAYRGTLKALAEATPFAPAPSDLPEFLTRKETALLLRISLVSLHGWSKNGVLQSLSVHGRIRYRRVDVLACLHEVKNGKTKR